jgi:phage N-6-adenine-methyltransferase
MEESIVKYQTDNWHKPYAFKSLLRDEDGYEYIKYLGQFILFDKSKKVDEFKIPKKNWIKWDDLFVSNNYIFDVGNGSLISGELWVTPNEKEVYLDDGTVFFPKNPSDVTAYPVSDLKKLNPHGNKTDLGDRRSTPTHVVQSVQDWFGLPIQRDVCAENWSAVVQDYWTKEDDSLSKDWTDLVNWMNPPYSKPVPWVAKAASQSLLHNVFVIGLVVDDRSTNWWQEYVEGEASICLIPDQRISFIRADTGEPEKGNPKASAIPIWTPWRTGRTEYIRIKI